MDFHKHIKKAMRANVPLQRIASLHGFAVY
jgi:hypothetical protein